jgi:hypothetical protein
MNSIKPNHEIPANQTKRQYAECLETLIQIYKDHGWGPDNVSAEEWENTLQILSGVNPEDYNHLTTPEETFTFVDRLPSDSSMEFIDYWHDAVDESILEGEMPLWIDETMVTITPGGDTDTIILQHECEEFMDVIVTHWGQCKIQFYFLNDKK